MADGAERNPDHKPSRRASNEPPKEWSSAETATCANGHEFSSVAGECPYCHEPTARMLRAARDPEAQEIEEPDKRRWQSAGPLTAVPALLRDFVASDIVQVVDNGRPPRTMHDYGYAKKIGLVNHIPVAPTLDVLTRYFRGELRDPPLGSTHFGIGRDFEWTYRVGNVLFGCATVHQYMPLYGVSPWAQGVIQRATASLVRGMRPGEPNGAFHSIENVAMSGRDGVTDPQFNSNVFMRAYLAALDGYPIDPDHQLWHSEIDGINRPDDPGWDGGLEDAMQDAARKLLRGDLSGIKGQWTDAPAPPPEPPTPEPPTPPSPLPDATLVAHLTIIRDHASAALEELGL